MADDEMKPRPGPLRKYKSIVVESGSLKRQVSIVEHSPAKKRKHEMK
jgi:hypothetical protein